MYEQSICLYCIDRIFKAVSWLCKISDTMNQENALINIARHLYFLTVDSGICMGTYESISQLLYHS